MLSKQLASAERHCLRRAAAAAAAYASRSTLKINARTFRVALFSVFLTMSSATRVLAAWSLLLCAMACAAIALLTVASSATENLALLSESPSHSSSVTALEARFKADAKAAAIKDAGAQILQAKLIKYEFIQRCCPFNSLIVCY
jgi:hypothetical protein